MAIKKNVKIVLENEIERLVDQLCEEELASTRYLEIAESLTEITHVLGNIKRIELNDSDIEVNKSDIALNETYAKNSDRIADAVEKNGKPI